MSFILWAAEASAFLLALRYEAPLSYWQWSVSFGLTYLIYKAEK